MPGSEEAIRVAPSYVAQMDAFLARSGAVRVPEIFHAVRRLTYHSSGNRDPAQVIALQRGACTAKHILLRDLLRHRGEIADVEVVGGDFAAGLPVSQTMPAELASMIRAAGIADAHCYVVWRGPDRPLQLDATWHDALKAHGFAVNAGWDGAGDTRLAIVPDGVKALDEDVIGTKMRFLALLSPDQMANRRVFLHHLSAWMETLEGGNG